MLIRHGMPHQLLQDMLKHSPCSPNHEQELSRRIQSGDVEARNELALSHMRFGAWMANRWHKHFSHIPYDEFLSAASLGLLKAADRFVPVRGAKFISYAVWVIRAGFFQVLAEFSGAIQVPEYQQCRLREIQHAFADGNPDALDLSEDEIQRVLDRRIVEVPIDRVVDVEGSNDEENWSGTIRLDETLAYEDDLLPDDDLFEMERISIMASLLGELDFKRRTTLLLYYDFLGRGATTYKEIGKTLGLTDERIRQMRMEALKRLRRSAHRAQLSSIR